MAGKVFGIGLNKTGTRSVASAMRLLGFRVMHKGDDATSALVDDAATSGEPLLSRLGDFDAYFDIDGLVHRFAELDAQYPGSKFILTTRDVESWIDSRRRHVEANQERKARGEYQGTFLTVDVDAWRKERDSHHRAVTEHFADRSDDLLVFDVIAGEGWERLAPFLGRRVPSKPFPWENRAGEGTYRPEPLLGKLRRRAQYVVAKARL